jgi:hypothetical protein
MKKVLSFLIAVLVLAQIAIAAESSNLEIDIPKAYEKVSCGDSLLFTIKFFNLANKGRMDIMMEYNVLDSKGEVKFTKSETVAVETQASFVRNFVVPTDFPLGMYTVQAKVTYSDNREVTAERSFEVVKKVDSNRFLIVGIIVLFILIIAYLSFKSRKIIEKIKIRSKIHSIVKKKHLK